MRAGNVRIDAAGMPGIAGRRMDHAQLERTQPRLTGLYRNMPTDEIRRRIADPDLVPLAREAAEAELLRRTSPSAEDTPKTADDAGDQRFAAIVGAVVSATVLALTWLLASEEFFFLLLLLLIPTIAAPLGKLFPRIGLGLGGVLVALPIGLGLWAWKTGHLAFSRGGDHFVEALIVSVILFFVLALSWAVGGSLIQGARHRGSWAELNREIDEQRDEAISSMRRRD